MQQELERLYFGSGYRAPKRSCDLHVLQAGFTYCIGVSLIPCFFQENELQAQNDIIAQLTREMRLNSNGHLSGGSDVESSGSTSTLNNLNNPAATAERIAALAFQAKQHNSSSNPVASISSSIPLPIAACRMR